MRLPFFTIGHSNQDLASFLELLRDPHINRVVDIRHFPRSRSNPQFNEDTLPEALSASGISYEHLSALGGRRGKSPNVPWEVNGYWTHESFHNYADYALTEDFQVGLQHLLAEGHNQQCAIMCSEALWWRCHRRIVADYLIAHGETVFHIMAHGRREPARLTPGAVIQSGGMVMYPAVKRSNP